MRREDNYRVLIVSDYAYVSGGGAHVALASAKALRRSGLQVTVFAAVGPVDPELAEAGVEVVCLNKPRYSESGKKRALLEMLSDRDAAEAFSRLVASKSGERLVVHIHAFVDALSASVPQAARRLGVPTAYTIHDYNFGCPYGGFYDYRRQRICPLTGLSFACWMTNCSTSPYPRKLYRNLRMAVQRGKGLPNVEATYLALTRFSRNVIEPYLPQGATIVEVPNPASFDKMEPSTPAANKDFVFIGRLGAEKGPDLFAHAARMAGVPAVIVGDGPIRAEVAAANAEVKMLGWKKPPEVASILRSARALVFPSRWYEGQPLVVQEALAAGVPVLASDRCAAVDAVQDGSNGLLFRIGDADDLAAKLRLLAGDDALVGRLGAAAYEGYWTDAESMDRHIERLRSVYEELLGKQDRARIA